MKKNYLIAIILISVFANNVFALEPHFMKDPTISPDGKTVCFSYLSDLWTVPFEGGEAKRITAIDGKDSGPVFSPDGNLIAFNSNRDGFNGIYLIPTKGGKARCVCKENLTVQDWFTKKTLFGSKNDGLLATGYETGLGSNFFYVPLDDSRPEEITGIGDNFCSLSPDNKKIIYQKRGYPFRERYKGSHNGNLWEYDLENKRYKKLTNTDYTERYPVFSADENTIYFAAADFIDDNEAVLQLCKVKNNDFKNPEQLTDFEIWSVRDISIAKENDRIVFEKFDEIWKFEPQSNEVAKLDIQINQDIIKNFTIDKEYCNVAENFAISPNGKFVVFTYKFDLFAVPEKSGEVKKITDDHQGVKDIAIMDDNKTIYFTKIIKGKPTLFKTDIAKLAQIKKVKKFQDKYIEKIKSDVHGNLIVTYSDDESRYNLAILKYENNEVEEFEIDAPIFEFVISPDEKYAFYITARSGTWDHVLWLRDFEDEKTYNILPIHGSISNVFWGEYGNYAFLRKNREICRISLQSKEDFWDEENNWKEILEPEEEKDEDKEDKDEKSDEDAEMDEKKEEEEKIKISIEVDDIRKRIKEISSKSGYNSIVAIAPDSTIYYLNIDRTKPFKDRKYILRKMNYDGEKDEEYQSFKSYPTGITFHPENSCFYFVENNQLKKLTKSKKVETIENEFDYSYNSLELNKTIFEHVWKTFGWNFYDPKMHNIDWEKMYERYYPYVKYTYDPKMMGDIIDEMIGQVNASHTGFYPRSDNDTKMKRRAYGGFTLDYTDQAKKGIRFKKIFRKSKLNKPFNIQPGDVLLTVDGIEITDETAITPLFFGKVGKKIEMEIQTSDSIKHVDIEGISRRDQYNMHYDNWVDERKEMVENSNDDIGYMHIRQMGWGSYEKFKQDIFANNFDKKAVIIDVRDNPGGWIHDYLIELLTKKPYGFSSSRIFNAEKTKFPADVWDKPIVLLINQNSFSDAEIFPKIFKQLDIGKIIGMPTSGSVIGTGYVGFMDGSGMRMPGTGWFTGDGANMEGNGAEPDIYIDLTPEQKIEDDDVQLQKAIEVLSNEL